MDSLRNLSHHAYAISGEKSLVLEKLYFILEKQKIKTKGNPDFWFGEFETFGINEGRMVNDLQRTKPVMGGKKIYVISLDSITSEAQNSLLKMFEEPASNSVFFLVIPTLEIFLPTLKSRLETLNLSQDQYSTESVKKFIQAGVSERMGMVSLIAESKDRKAAIDFLSNLEKFLSKDNTSLKENASTLTEILKYKSYLNDRSPSIKMVLEHIALVI